MKKDAEYVIRSYQPGDEAALLALHNSAFDGAVPRSLEHWRWRFLQNPLGFPEITLAINDEGRCTAVYAAISHHLLLNGKPILGGLQTDVAIAPDHRTGLAGGRQFVSVGKLFRERFVTPQTGVEWGFPEPPLQRICIRYLKVGVLRDVVFLCRPAERKLSFACPELETHRVERFSGEVDELWDRCKSDHVLATIRNAAYLNWRYADHPDIDYGLVEVREPQTRRLRGVAVFREGGWDHQLLSIMDWLCPFKDREVEARLLHHLAHETKTRAKLYLIAWMPSPGPVFHRFQQDYGFLAKVTPFQESYRSWSKGADRRWLADHWYQTMGDIDFF
jgi:hypothetical protein